MGVDNNQIFISSIPGNGIKEKISDEIRNALRESKLDIVLLSSGYFGSPYCLNELGAIWFKDSSTKLVISIEPDIRKKMVGFLNPDHKYYRVEKETSEILDRILESLGLDNPKPTEVDNYIKDFTADWESCKREKKHSDKSLTNNAKTTGSNDDLSD